MIGTDDGVGPEFNTSHFSRFGLSGSVELNEYMDGMFQFTYHQYNRLGEGFTPHVEYALLNYRKSEALSFRMGRLSFPIWLISEYRSVGYLHPWIRPPMEVYGLNPIGSLNGVNAITKYNSEAFNLSFEIYLGGTSIDTLISYTTRIKSNNDLSILGSTFKLDSELGNFRASYARSNNRVDTNLITRLPLPTASPGIIVNTDVITNFEMGWLEFSSLGYQKKRGAWMFMAEQAMIRGDRSLVCRMGAYATLQYEIIETKDFLSYTYSELLKNDLLLSTGTGRQLTSTLGYKHVFNSNFASKLEYSKTQFIGAGFANTTDLRNLLAADQATRPEFFETFGFAVDTVF